MLEMELTAKERDLNDPKREFTTIGKDKYGNPVPMTPDEIIAAGMSSSLEPKC